MSFIGVFLDNKKFQILQKNMNKIDKTLINIKKKSIENVKNVKFDIIVISENLENLKEEINYVKNFCMKAKYLVINSDIEINCSILKEIKTNEKYVPYVIEPSLGADRVVLAFLCNSYDEEEISEGDIRVVLHLHPALAPYKVAVLPLSKKLSEKAEEVYTKLSKKFMCDYDVSGSIGKRYRREDEIGTPYCVTVDFDTLEDETVTVRDRDTMEQIRLKIDDLEKWIEEKIEF